MELLASVHFTLPRIGSGIGGFAESLGRSPAGETARARLGEFEDYSDFADLIKFTDSG
ncbi:hypothetical protein Mal33_18140 [Rosistilla oblonga]|uniref:Uncharacterized protein n=1 Tax=Rosistilla oblonga TaxID=2527990 RepID=A0A518IRW6_9BACT|nr:hypothetical protein Mal33_18140 [Rosistilla oblonga]